MTPDDEEGNQGFAQPCLLIYDGECRLCVSTKRKLEQAGAGQAGSDVRFLSYQSDEARYVLGEQYCPGRPDMAFLVQPSGTIYRGLDAFLPLMPRLPGGRFLFHCLRIPFFKALAEWGYRVVARHRYRLFGETRSSQSQD